MTLVFSALPPLQNCKGNSLSGALNARSVKKLRFLTETAVYLGNGTR